VVFWLWYQDTNLIRLTTVGREFQYLVITEEIKCPPKSADLTESLAILIIRRTNPCAIRILPVYASYRGICDAMPTTWALLTVQTSTCHRLYETFARQVCDRVGVDTDLTGWTLLRVDDKAAAGLPDADPRKVGIDRQRMNAELPGRTGWWRVYEAATGR
jgi:hypothetical protein